MSDNLPMILKGNEFPITKTRTTPYRTIYQKGNVSLSFRLLPNHNGYRLQIGDEEVLFDSKSFKDLYLQQSQKDFMKKLRVHHPYASTVLMRNKVSWQDARDVIKTSYEIENENIEKIVSGLQEIGGHSEKFIGFLEERGKKDLAKRLNEITSKHRPNNL